MKPGITTHLPPHPAIERIRRFRLFYAIGVHAGSFLVLAAILVAFQVREIRTVAQLEIMPVAGPEITGDQLCQSISGCIRNAASDQKLKELLTRCLKKSSQDVPNPQYSPADLDRLRQRMAFAVLPVRDSRNYQVSLVLAGHGNQIEAELVESFLAQISDEVAMVGARKRQGMIGSSEYQVLVSRRNDLLERANAQLQDANSQIVSLAQQVIATHDPSNRVATTPNENDREGSGANRFKQISYAGDKDAGTIPDAATWRERFTRIPLSELSGTFVEIEKSWNDTLRPLGELVEEQDSNQDPVVMRATRRGETLTIPYGMNPSREWSLLAMVAALAVGCVLASGVDPRWHDPGLGSVEEIEKCLGVPVLGQIRPAPGGTSPVGRHWSVRILKLNELIVFTTLLAILVVAVGSSDIRETLVHNPLQAVAKIVWQIRSWG